MKELKLAEMRARPLCSRMMSFGLAEPRRSGWGTRKTSRVPLKSLNLLIFKALCRLPVLLVSATAVLLDGIEGVN